MKILKYILAYTISFTIILTSYTIVNAEQIIESFVGIDNANEIIKNVDFVDVKSQPDNYWAKDAIYKMAGLEIIKGYGQKDYRPSRYISKAELITLIYRSLGQEEQSQIELEKFRKDTIFEITNRDIPAIWAEGYLLLAKNDGLITELEFYQSIMPNTYVRQDGRFFSPNDIVTRQQAAVWIAKAFKIEPVYDQNEVFNSYKDWEEIDYENIPYVEALLIQNIMSGDDGYFYPNHILKRDEITQVMSNIEDKIYEINNYKKMYGYVENIVTSDNIKIGNDTKIKTILVRGEDGSLNSINLSAQIDSSNPNKIEINNHNNNYNQKDIIVNKDGTLGNSRLLEKKDRLLIIFDNEKAVRFVQAKSAPNYQTSSYGIINSIDLGNNTFEFTDTEGKIQNYTVSKGAAISINNIGKGFEDITVGDKAYIVYHNDIATYIEISKEIYNENPNSDEGKNDARGIVKEVNSNLNYISLYGPQGEKNVNDIKTYNFSKNVIVKKDGEIISAKDIVSGDTVYLEIDDDNKIHLINVKSNYYNSYGEIHSLGENYMIVKYEDGTLQRFDLNDELLIYINGGISSKDDLFAGDRLKLTLTSNEDNAELLEITLEDRNHLVSNIYKGQVHDINKNQLILYNTKVFDSANWNIKDQKGFIKFDIDKSTQLFADNKKINFDSAYSTFLNKNVYIAVVSDYGQNEKVLKVISLDGHEKLYNDYISYNYNSSSNIELKNSFEDIAYSDATIVVKYGRLTMGSNIKTDDPAYLVGLRDPKTNAFTASIIEIDEKPTIAGIDLYRGRISSIDEGNSFVVESFSKLIGHEWSYQNTPKTFDINNDTYITNLQGIVNNRDFVDYGLGSYKNKEVYIVAQGNIALEISDAPFAGEYNIRGTIFNITSSISEDSVVELHDVTSRNNTTGVWSYIGEDSINIYENCIIIKNKQLCKIKDLEIGDEIRVIKNSKLPDGNASIILVED